METQDKIRRLYRSRDERLIAGVAGRLGAYFGIDPTLARILLALVLVAATGPFAPLTYAVLVWLIPPAPVAG